MVFLDDKWEYLHVLYDIYNKQPIVLETTKTETKIDIKNFIDKSIECHERKCIVTDLKIEYRDIMQELGFDHQLCIFHFIQNLSKKINQQIKEDKQNLKTKLKTEYKNISYNKLDEMIDEMIEYTINHYSDCKKEIIENI